MNDFLTIQEETFLDDRYDEIHDILIEKCKDWFGEYLFEIYQKYFSNRLPSTHPEG